MPGAVVGVAVVAEVAEVAEVVGVAVEVGVAAATRPPTRGSKSRWNAALEYI